MLGGFGNGRRYTQLIAELTQEFESMQLRNHALMRDNQSMVERLHAQTFQVQDVNNQSFCADADDQIPKERNQIGRDVLELPAKQHGVETPLVSSGRSSPTRNTRRQSKESAEATRLADTFLSLCVPGSNTITCKELAQQQLGLKGMYGSKQMESQERRFAQALKIFNASTGAPGRRASNSEPHVDTNTYSLLISTSDEQLCNEFNHNCAEALKDIRQVLLSHEAATEIVDVTLVDRHELNPETKVKTRAHRTLVALDPVIGVVILLNAILTGVQLELERSWPGWQWLEVAFTFIFMMEVLLKFVLLGVHSFFMGDDRCWNLFDIVVVLLAVSDSLIFFLGDSSALSSFTVIRILRFGRLTKLVRVLKLKMFKELRLLIDGVIAGVRTLIWAIVLLGFFIYSIAVLLRQTVGNPDEKFRGCDPTQCPSFDCPSCSKSARHFSQYRMTLFGSVGRSMLTVFRCFTDGCSSVDGTPLPVYIWDAYGSLAVMFYVIVILFVTFGLFNLIMAIFVESTFESAKADASRRRHIRHLEHVQIARKLQHLLLMICSDQQDTFQEQSDKTKPWLHRTFGTSNADIHFKNNMQPGVSMKHYVGPQEFERIIDEPAVQQMLSAMDVSIGDWLNLFDVLDADGNRRLNIGEIVHGLMKLRGGAEKCDIVSLVLMLRSTQSEIKQLVYEQKEQGRVMDEIMECLRNAGTSSVVAWELSSNNTSVSQAYS